MFNLSEVKIYDGQSYVCEAVIPHTKLDGTETQLALWRSECARCGEPFTLKTTMDPDAPFAPNRRCVAHRRPGSRVKKNGRF